MKIAIQDNSRELKKVLRLVNKGLFKDPTHFVRSAINHYYDVILSEELSKAAIAQQEILGKDVQDHMNLQVEDQQHDKNEEVGRLATGSR